MDPVLRASACVMYRTDRWRERRIKLRTVRQQLILFHMRTEIFRRDAKQIIFRSEPDDVQICPSCPPAPENTGI